MGAFRPIIRRARQVDVNLTVHRGSPDALDRLAEVSDPAQSFLRAQWFRAAGAYTTLIASGADGAPLIALPVSPLGPPSLRARGVTGSYWPFRAVPISAAATATELEAILATPQCRAALGRMWRLGPCYADDPSGSRLIRAATAAGWTPLIRELGETFVIDVQALQAAGQWPRTSTLKRIRNYERQLAATAPLTLERVEGKLWSDEAFEALAVIEQASWITTRTDGTGAKFLDTGQGNFWREATADPVIAAMLSATILRVGGRPVAFCFDLNVGEVQYALAGSHDSGFDQFKPGKIATYRNIEWALERGIQTIDLGSGDSGYKREMGATAGPKIVDILFVRSRPVAAMLRSAWKASAQDGVLDRLKAMELGRAEQAVLGSLATVAAAAAMAID